MARGGKREGSGRKKGEETKIRSEAALKALTSGLTPLDIMLGGMRSAYEAGGYLAAMPFAIAAAPFVHPRLANIEAKVDGVLAHYAAQPIPVEQRHSDSLASTAGTSAHSDPTRHSH